MPAKASAYWLARAIADEKRANRLANAAAEEIKSMYRRQYLKIVKQITALKGDILDSGKELTRTQLWTYSRWRQLEQELGEFVGESTRMQIDETTKVLDEVFKKTIGKSAASYAGSRMTAAVPAQSVINTTWSGKRYSERIWTNQAAIAERIKISMEDMLVQGRGLPEIKKEIMNEFGVGFREADRLVRTEAAYVLNKASVEKYRSAGIRKIQWSTGPEDGDECAICAARSDKVYFIDQAPMIPAHPRCRCVYAGVVELEGENIPVDGPAADAALEAGKVLF